RDFADGDTVPVALGGTGAATAAGARTSLGLGSAAVRPALGSTGALYSRDSILGAVSQASGIPSGAIIERGSNAN
ncbi:phage tail protein, partial [Pseudomonas aeruginosa]